MIKTIIGNKNKLNNDYDYEDISGSNDAKMSNYYLNMMDEECEEYQGYKIIGNKIFSKTFNKNYGVEENILKQVYEEIDFEDQLLIELEELI